MLRHATGYKLANDGQDTRAIQHYLGHRNIEHTTRYTELQPTASGLFGPTDHRDPDDENCLSGQAETSDGIFGGLGLPPVLHSLVPAQEVAQVVHVATQRGRRQVLARDWRGTADKPLWVALGGRCRWRCLYCTQ